MLPPRLIDAKPIPAFRLWLKFAGGPEGEVDLLGELYGEVFEALREEAFFARGRFDRDINTVVWPNGADFAPEFLHSALLRSVSTD
jgi:hypothetical protein